MIRCALVARLRSSHSRLKVTAHVCASARLSGNAPRMRATRHACAPRATPDVLSSHISKLTFKPYCDLRLRDVLLRYTVFGLRPTANPPNPVIP